MNREERSWLSVYVASVGMLKGGRMHGNMERADVGGGVLDVGVVDV